MNIFIPILILGSLGLLFGLGLAIASKKFSVAVDPNLEKVFSCLPGANCGACGMPGCIAFAQSLIKGGSCLDSCRVIEEEARKKLVQILGIELKTQVRQTAVLLCAGGNKVKDRFQYNGLEDCVAANLLLQGHKECVYGCLGFGSCVKACPFGAIRMSQDGLPIIDIEKCRACSRCVEVCPKGLFSLIPVVDPAVSAYGETLRGRKGGGVYVACSSNEVGRQTRAVCPVGCIACRKCERACPVGAIEVIDNLARIDYNKCTSCGECVKVCPVKCIRI